MNNEQLQELFYEIMEEALKEQPINESEEFLDEAAVLYEALESFFVENYRHLDVTESVVAVVRGINVNEELYDVMSEALLDESIGTAVATVVHAIGQRRAAKKAAAADSAAQKASDVAHNKGVKAAARTLATKKADKSNTGSAVGTFKSAFARARSDRAYADYKKAKDTKAAAQQHATTSQATLQAKQQKRADLATKIDSKVQSAKEKIKSGVKKAAGFAGRMLGKVL